jgi:hypothetical protein
MPQARLTVRIREGKGSDRSRCAGGGSRGPGCEGMVRKCRDGEEVARHRSWCVGETDSDHRGGEGIGYVD